MQIPGRPSRTPGGAAPTVVTDAQVSLADDIDARRRRYVLTMLVRTVLFIAAVFLFRGWLRYVAAGLSLVLPYVAVVMANAGKQRPAGTPTVVQVTTSELPAIGPDRTIDG